MYKQAINLHINIKDFFDVYPPLIKVFIQIEVLIQEKTL